MIQTLKKRYKNLSNAKRTYKSTQYWSLLFCFRVFSSQKYTVNCWHPEFSILQKLQENSHKLKFHVAFLCHVDFFRIQFLWVFVPCWVAVLTVLQKYLAGLSKNALGGWRQRHQRVTTTQHALRLSSSIKMRSCYGPLMKLWFAFLACWNRSTVWCHMPLNSRLMSLPFVHHAYTCTLALP